MGTHSESLLAKLSASVGHRTDGIPVRVRGADALPSAFAVTDLAVASIANACRAARRVAAMSGGSPEAPIEIDARLASLWFGISYEPLGWEPAPLWDSIAGIYECGESFVRLHTNAPHHKAAALRVLDCPDDREQVAAAVASLDPVAVENAVVEAGGVAAAFRSRSEWVAHPQGAALQHEPLVHRTMYEASKVSPSADRSRPLAGVRVLDLTRVLAGPVATRFLASLGADVLRIDPPVWDEAGVAAEVNLGKRCTRLDLRDSADRSVFERLLSQAHIFVHGYRRDALMGLGYGQGKRRELNPSLVDVSLNAWGHTGPWRDRRGFDSIVQIAAGVAHEGMTSYGLAAPKPLPVQALDHATGYTLAACALHGWADRLEHGPASNWKTSLAAHAELLWPTADGANLNAEFQPLSEGDLGLSVEQTSWGAVRRASLPMQIEGIDVGWTTGATNHGTSPAEWASAP